MAISKNVITFAAAIEEDSRLIGRFKFHLTFLTLDQMQASLLWFSLNRKVGRVIDRAGLEIRYTLMGIGGLNPSPSAKGNIFFRMRKTFHALFSIIGFEDSHALFQLLILVILNE